MSSIEELSSRKPNTGNLSKTTTGLAASSISSGEGQLDSLMSNVDSVKQLATGFSASSVDTSLFADFAVSQILKLVNIEKFIRKIIERILKDLDICELINSLPLAEVEEIIKVLIDLKNKAIELLVKILRTITNILTVTSILQILIKVFNTVINLLPQIALAIPSSVPPGVGVPVGVGVNFSKTLEKMKWYLLGAECILTIINKTLSFIAEKLSPAIDILKAINWDLFQCAEKLALAQARQEKPNATIKDQITQDKFNDLIGEITPIPEIDLGVQKESYKGFTFDIKAKKTVEGTPQNYAIALDVRGIQVLESLPSFASDTNVLINELKLTIDRNNLSGF